MSLPSRGAWIEILLLRDLKNNESESLPSRGAWIEILLMVALFQKGLVAPFTGMRCLNI